VPLGTFTCALLYDGEVGLDVPTEPHDRPVLAAATPSGVTMLGR
jgi:5-formyltetrahydrofolate cyclo-ligase